jgi:hypothetical protein
MQSINGPGVSADAYLFEPKMSLPASPFDELLKTSFTSINNSVLSKFPDLLKISSDAWKSTARDIAPSTSSSQLMLINNSQHVEDENTQDSSKISRVVLPINLLNYFEQILNDTTNTGLQEIDDDSDPNCIFQIDDYNTYDESNNPNKENSEKLQLFYNNEVQALTTGTISLDNISGPILNTSKGEEVTGYVASPILQSFRKKSDVLSIKVISCKLLNEDISLFTECECYDKYRKLRKKSIQ